MDGFAAVEILIEKPVEAVAADESLTPTMNENAPAKLGTPKISPVVEFSVSPEGKRPAPTLQR
jgi:hypothetical protein